MGQILASVKITRPAICVNTIEDKITNLQLLQETLVATMEEELLVVMQLKAEEDMDRH